MKRLVPVVLLLLGACESSRDRRFEITVPPEVLATATNTSLLVPRSCPAYAPGGGDVDTPEAPFPEHVAIICGVDEAGGTYGLVTGDAPTAGLAVLPGNQELGLYIGVKPSAHFVPETATVVGDGAVLRAWSAPTNVHSSTACCPEGEPNSQRTLQLIAVGPQGMLISLGRFDRAPLQVAFALDTAALTGSTPGPGYGGWWGRFYVHGAP
jgi:hypothetical protein